MKRKRTADMEIVVRFTTENRIAAFLDHGTRRTPRMLDTCSSYDNPKMLDFVRRWRAAAVTNYVSFTLSYELSYLLREPNGKKAPICREKRE